MDTIKLRQPLKVNGRDLDELKLDFDAITPDAFISADRESKVKKNGAGSTMAETDYTFHLYLAFEAAVAADPAIDMSDLERIKGSDLLRLMSAGRFFYLNSVTGSMLESLEDASESTPTSTDATRSK